MAAYTLKAALAFRCASKVRSGVRRARVRRRLQLLYVARIDAVPVIRPA